MTFGLSSGNLPFGFNQRIHQYQGGFSTASTALISKGAKFAARVTGFNEIVYGIWDRLNTTHLSGEGESSGAKEYVHLRLSYTNRADLALGELIRGLVKASPWAGMLSTQLVELGVVSG